MRTEEPAKTHIRFELDPLSEYLGAMRLLERNNRHDGSWQMFFEELDKKSSSPMIIRGFLLALRDCCAAYGEGYRVPDFVQAQLTERLPSDHA